MQTLNWAQATVPFALCDAAQQRRESSLISVGGAKDSGIAASRCVSVSD